MQKEKKNLRLVKLALIFCMLGLIFALSGFYHYSSIIPSCCRSDSLTASYDSTTKVSSSSQYATTKSSSALFATTISLSLYVYGLYETQYGSESISPLKVNSGLPARGNVDLVFRVNPSTINTTSCEVKVTLFQKGVYGSSVCISSTSEMNATFRSFDGQYYHYVIGPINLPSPSSSENYALQINVQFAFPENQSQIVTYNLLAGS